MLSQDCSKEALMGNACEAVRIRCAALDLQARAPQTILIDFYRWQASQVMYVVRVCGKPNCGKVCFFSSFVRVSSLKTSIFFQLLPWSRISAFFKRAIK